VSFEIKHLYVCPSYLPFTLSRIISTASGRSGLAVFKRIGHNILNERNSTGAVVAGNDQIVSNYVFAVHFADEL
jgi:hypothetical protein